MGVARARRCSWCLSFAEGADRGGDGNAVEGAQTGARAAMPCRFVVVRSRSPGPVAIRAALNLAGLLDTCQAPARQVLACVCSCRRRDSVWLGEIPLPE